MKGFDGMDMVLQVQEALQKKKEFFLEYEGATRALLDCGVDDMTDYITKRTQLAIEIDKIDAHLSEICSDTPKGDLLGDVIANRCAYGEAPGEWQCLFDAGQEVLGTVSRIAQLEGQVLTRMQVLRADFKKKISDSQNTPKIAKYLTGLGGKADPEQFISNKA